MTEIKLDAAEIAHVKAIGDKSGMGVADALEEAPAAPEEEASVENKPEEAKPEAKPTAPEEEAGKDKGEEDDGEDDDEDDASSRPRTVPYATLKAERQKQGELRTQITEIQNTLAQLLAKKNDTTKAEELDNIEDEAKKLGDEVGMDSTALAKLLRKTVEIAKRENKGALPPEITARLAILDKIEEEQKAKAETDTAKEEAAHFANEWNTLTADLKKQYPNATPAMLDEAKREMDALAHSKTHHKHDLDYILFKNKGKFETLLKVAPKGKSGEAGKHIGSEQDFSAGEDEENLTNIEDLTPAIVKSRENRSISHAESSPKDYRIQHPIT